MYCSRKFHLYFFVKLSMYIAVVKSHLPLLILTHLWTIKKYILAKFLFEEKKNGNSIKTTARNLSKWNPKISCWKFIRNRKDIIIIIIVINKQMFKEFFCFLYSINKYKKVRETVKKKAHTEGKMNIILFLIYCLLLGVFLHIFLRFFFLKWKLIIPCIHSLTATWEHKLIVDRIIFEIAFTFDKCI